MATMHSEHAAAGGAVARRMERADWAWVQRWFEDETLDRELGPLDTDWLEHVLAETDGVELVIEAPHPATGLPAPIALVGVVWGDAPAADAMPGIDASGGSADAGGNGHGITDLAIDPARRGYGLGRSAIDAAIAWPGHPPTRSWVAFVDRDNSGARAFFAAIGWAYEGLDGEGDEAMHRFAHTPVEGPAA